MSDARRTLDTPSGLHLTLDRSLPIPVGVQLRGQIEYGIATGEIARGTRLPSVRELAAALAMAPATVSQVYKELRETGLITSQQGLGTFVPERLPPTPESEALAALHRAVGALFAEAEGLGFTRAAAAEAATLRASQAPLGGRGLELLYVGIYDEATEAYAANVRSQLPHGDAVRATTFARLRAEGLPEPSPHAYVTLVHREQSLRALTGADAVIVPLTMIPSGETRMRLARLPADSRLAAVASLGEFLPTLRQNVGRYAPHVADVRPSTLEASALDDVLRWCTALVYATGTDAVRQHAPPGLEVFEFRYEPDTRAVTRYLLPLLDTLRPPAAPKETFA